MDRFTVQAETTADDVINWIKSFGSGKKAINLFQTGRDLMFGEAGNFYILLARNAIAQEITGIAINSWNQHTFSFKYDNAFSYSRLISNTELNPTAASDLNDIDHGFTFLSYGVNTLNSPYKEGITGNTTAGGVISFGYSDYGTQIAIPAGTPNTGNNLFVRTMAHDSWSKWESK